MATFFQQLRHEEVSLSQSGFAPTVLRGLAPMKEVELLRFADLNPEFQFEQTANGELVVSHLPGVKQVSAT